MKKIILLIGICGMMEGVRGQETEKISSPACPDDLTVSADSVYTFGVWYWWFWNYFPLNCQGANSPGDEYIIHFTPSCSNMYAINYNCSFGNYSVSYRVSNFNNCDTAGYICLTPGWGGTGWEIDLSLDSNVTYDFLFENNSSLDSVVITNFKISRPRISDIQFYDITPSSITVSWDGNFDDMVIEYGLKGFTPGSDTIPGSSGTIIHNPVSPFTFTAVMPDSTYDFYFREKCGVYSPNSVRYRKRIPFPDSSITFIYCDTTSLHYYSTGGGYSYVDAPGAWTLNSGYSCDATGREKIWKYTPLTTGIHNFIKVDFCCSGSTFVLFYKEASLGLDEHNWNTSGGFNHCCVGIVGMGPLTAGTTYYIMIKSIQGDYCNFMQWNNDVTLRFDCPASCYIPYQPSYGYVTSSSVVVSESCCFFCNPVLYYEYGLSGFTPGTDSLPGTGGTIIESNNWADTITGLTPYTWYDVYARRYCDTVSAFSDNSILSKFRTLPLCSVAPDSIHTWSPGNTICSGQSVSLAQIGGMLSINGAFHWYADSCGGISLGTGSSVNFYPTDTTTYYVRAEDSCGITTCASITINVNPSPPPPTISGDTSICAGTSTILTASGGYACYLWSMASTTQSVTVSNTGVYMVTVCDANGCTASASIAVIVYPNPVPVITGNTTICQGSSVTLNPGLTYYCYMWSNGATTATINVSTSGTYTVTVCDANGCTGSASVTVTVIPNPVPVITGNTTICQGSSTTLNAGSGYVSYLWSTSTTTQVINVSVTGPYTVTVTNANLCTGSASIVVTVLPLPSAMISGNSSICSGGCASITVSFTGTAPFAYSYTDGMQTFGPIVTSVTPITINACPTFTTTYTLVSVNDVNCAGTVSGSATITVSPNPTAVIIPSVTTYICLGDTVYFTANTGAGFIYQWYKNSLPISGAVNSFYDAFATGNYSFALTDSNGCSNLSSSTHVQIICFPPLEPSELRMSDESNDDIILIPNPASHEITIQTGRVIQRIKIFDVVGQQVYSLRPDTLRLRRIKPETKINISNFSKGIYFVILDTGKEKVVKKFFKE